jgi:hypothetical protein
MNLLETEQNVDQAALQAAAQEKDRRARASQFKDLQILMLDALADPLLHSQAVAQFVRLYRTPLRPGASERVRSNCTGC